MSNSIKNLIYTSICFLAINGTALDFFPGSVGGSSGGGSGMVVGDPVSGGSNNTVLFKDGSGNLGSSENLKYNSATSVLSSTYVFLSTGSAGNPSLSIGRSDMGFYAGSSLSPSYAGLYVALNGITDGPRFTEVTGTGVVQLRFPQSSVSALAITGHGASGNGIVWPVNNGMSIMSKGNEAFFFDGDEGFISMNITKGDINSGRAILRWGNADTGWLTEGIGGNNSSRDFLIDIVKSSYAYVRSNSTHTFLSQGQDAAYIDTQGYKMVAVATQTITAGATITPNQCGGIKRISSAGAVTTSTTETFATLVTNIQCVMSVCNVGANDITLDENAGFFAGGADLILQPNFCSMVGWDGVVWRTLVTL